MMPLGNEYPLHDTLLPGNGCDCQQKLDMALQASRKAAKPGKFDGESELAERVRLLSAHPDQLWSEQDPKAVPPANGPQSPSEETLETIRTEAERRGLPAHIVDELVQRTKVGYEVYGEVSHLAADFDVEQEILEELQDAFNLACMKLRRGEGGEGLLNVVAHCICVAIGYEEDNVPARSPCKYHAIRPVRLTDAEGRTVLGWTRFRQDVAVCPECDEAFQIGRDDDKGGE